MLGLQNSLEFRTPRLTALIATLPSSSRHLSHDYVTDRQMVNSARKHLGGCIIMACRVIAMRCHLQT